MIEGYITHNHHHHNNQVYTWWCVPENRREISRLYAQCLPWTARLGMVYGGGMLDWVRKRMLPYQPSLVQRAKGSSTTSGGSSEELDVLQSDGLELAVCESVLLPDPSDHLVDPPYSQGSL